MDPLRLGRVALEDHGVVLEARHELDDVEPAREGDVAERPLVGVVALVEEDEPRCELVEERAARDRRSDRCRQHLREQAAGPRVVELDLALVEIAGDGRERLAADVGAVEGQRLQIGRRRDLLEERSRLRPRVLHLLGAEVVVEGHEAAHAVELEVPAREVRVRQRQDDRLETLELQRFREHPLELHLVGRVAQARDQRRSAVRRRRGRHDRAVAAAERPVVALGDRPGSERPAVEPDRLGKRHGCVLYRPKSIRAP